MKGRISQLDLDALFDVGEESGTREKATENHADSVDAFVGNRRPRRRGRPQASEHAVGLYIEDAVARARSGDWHGVDPGQVGGLMVALYIVCHERVYGVRPMEAMTGDAFPAASLAAKQMHVGAFKADVLEMVEFIRWTWDREKARDRARRETRRIGWRLQFDLGLFTDYKADQMRKRRE